VRKPSDHSRRRRDWNETLREMPYVRLALAFLGGIAWQCHAYPFHFHFWPVTVLLFFLFLLTLIIPYCHHYAHQWISGLSGLLFLFAAGVTAVQFQPQESRLPLQHDIYIKAVAGETTAGQRYLKMPAVVLAYADSSGTHALREKTILYLEPDSTQPLPVPGDTLLTLVRLSELPPPQNPGEFDYRTYMKRRHVFTSGFIRRTHYTVVPAQTKSLRNLPAQLRGNTQQIFATKGIADDEFAVLNALTLGDKKDLDQDLRQAYSASGATHILAVSGLHVGIIFAILSILFSFLEKKQNGKLFKNILCIFCLWCYAALVGFSPSVTRATVMFSFVLAGQMMRRHISIYNSLAASAFFICLFCPFDLFDTGFQLSYCAVISIVYFQPAIYRLSYTRHKITDYFWQLLSVSFAAQIGTLPITLASFHQFPNYFLLTNIFVIPLTGVIVYLSAALLTTAWIPAVSDIIALCLDKSLWLLNHGVRFIEQMPYSVTSNIYISPSQLCAMIVLALLFMLYIETKNRWLVWISTYLLIGFFALGTWQSIRQQEQQFIAVYNVKNASYIHFIHGNHSVALRDSSTAGQPFDFNLKTFFISAGIAGKPAITLAAHHPLNDTTIQHLHIYRNFIIFENKLIKILHDEQPAYKQTAPVDYLIVTATAALRPAQALALYQPKQVILDASVPAFRTRQWETAVSEQAVALHNVKQHGAWIQTLKVKN
ncbi:MAG: ComEC family competence protein, partial [Prevotellaceae bacterium]|jgi:competence protein ComEC|nr:ComEC family competence protein [Prevotellaceae bacterium]